MYNSYKQVYAYKLLLLVEKVNKILNVFLQGLHGHMGQRKYSRMDQVKFFKYFFPQILLGPFLNDLSHLLIAHALIWFLNSGRDFTFT